MWGQAEDFSLFGEKGLIEAELRFDLSTYLRKNLKGQSLEGILVLNKGESDSLVKEVSIRTRGQFRLEKCSFAPMELTFKKPLKAYSDSGRIKKIKLVTHCKSGIVYDEYILKEYLVYHLYNVLTDSSFRVRLARLTYIDTEVDRRSVVQYAFFLEPKSVMALRSNATVVNTLNINQGQIFAGVMDRVSIFNYMVGNWDWAVFSKHNIEVIKPFAYDPLGQAIAVPYDFDLTGFVNPEYNMPPAESGLVSNKDRKFMGICRDEIVYRERLKEFMAKKEDLYGVINNFEFLNERVRKNCISYLDEFFDQLDRDKDIDNLIDHFIADCKK
jgi:hypothetical protein